MTSQIWAKESEDVSLLDEEFLVALSEQKERDLYARVTSLDINELPIERIEGKVTGGSINVDGDSNVRRTCNLTMVNDEIDINDFYWGVKTKFKLEIGLKNKLSGEFEYVEDGLYPDIVWFPQGIFVIASFNSSLSTTGYTVSISGKDKMCLLNGDLGGQLFASIDFGTEEIENKIMESVVIDSTTSDSLIVSNYYYEPDISNYPVEVLSNDVNYTFVVDNNSEYVKTEDNEIVTGKKYYTSAGVVIQSPTVENIGSYYEIVPRYYKLDNKYRQTAAADTFIDSESKYKLYKKALSPKEIFQQVDSISSNGVYYFEKEVGSSYYIKNNTNSAHKYDTDGENEYTNNYQLRPLYQIGYEYTIRKIPLEKIIRESVHAYAKEPFHNIIINDLDEYGLEQLTYRGDETLYAFRNVKTKHFEQLLLETQLTESFGNILSANFNFDTLTSEFTGSISGDTITLNGVTYYVAKIEYGTDVGYRLTDLTYTGDLVSSIGDSLTSVLDKIKTMLGNYEYFYDIDGHFVFQKKRTYVDTAWDFLSELEDEDTQVDFVYSDRKRFSFNFEGNRLITAINNTPVLNNLRNDFVVWGTRKSLSDVDIPIHARYAIDKKPVFYRSLSGNVYVSDIKYATEESETTTIISTSTLYEAIRNFDFQYAPTPELLSSMGVNINLTLPQWVNDSDGGYWGPGWWDIRDWARYYKLIMNTDETPNATMKYYSYGTEDTFEGALKGCVPLRTLGGQFSDYNESVCVWLIDITSTGRVNTGHGVGVPKENLSTWTDQRYVYYDEATGQNIEDTSKMVKMTSPYTGCAYTHTYHYFLNDEIETMGFKGVYFYNPKFPSAKSQQQLIEERVENEDFEYYTSNKVYVVDWREIIYQMALDYFAGQGCSESDPIYDPEGNIVIDTPDHFLSAVAARNYRYYPTGYTGYEQYYTDMQGFWRELYNPFYTPKKVYTNGSYITQDITGKFGYYTKKKVWKDAVVSDLEIEYYMGGYNTDAIAFRSSLTSDSLREKFDKYYDNDKAGWNVNVFNNPEVLNFWIEFLDDGYELAQFSIPLVSDRTKVVKEDKATAIVFQEIPDIIVCESVSTDGDTTYIDYSGYEKQMLAEQASGYTFIQIPKGFLSYFVISYRTLSCKNKIDDLLYQFGYCIENISLTTVPVYHLQPNTRIYVQDNETNINGEYIVSKLTIPLTYDGTMSITATKAPERFY